jgi:predicted amidophosphoribosyltransferase
VDGLLFGVPYADPVARGLLERWKFSFARHAEAPILEMLKRVPLERVLAGDDWTATSVPLHARRLRWRGFNQAEKITEVVAARLRLPEEQLLVRIKHTAQQARRGAKEKRRGDLAGVFAAKGPVSGRVILCDDVYTSGATMEAAASVLKSAGAASVWGVVIARG